MEVVGVWTGGEVVVVVVVEWWWWWWGGISTHATIALIGRILLKLWKELAEEAHRLRFRSMTLVQKFANPQLELGGRAEPS